MRLLFFLVLFLVSCTLFALRIPKWQIREPVDLSWDVDEDSLYWPGIQSFFYSRKVAHFDEENRWYAMSEFCTGEHGGTHLDAPYHFYKYGWKVGDIPLQRLIAHAVIVDMSDIVHRLGPNIQLQEADLIDWERIHGPIPTQCVLLVRFGWSKYYKYRDLYFGLNGTEMEFPGIAEDAAQWIVNSKKIVGVGVDTASLDYGMSTTFPTHRILFENSIYGIENLNIPRHLPARGFNVLVMPMKLKEGTGAPARVVAIPDVILTGDPCSALELSTSAVPWYGHTSVVLSSLLLLGMYAINCFTL
ncbi:cyclase-like protein 2 [Holotrichia oblita]|uniref:Cyclase-like protein 2 n=1 Tax=Holotrichia oblita TaxID=644536 RepID=A0ACB9SRK0_HOLOL|nr:cyclase-like protein 2 [Holotrichia oblita]